MIGVSEIMPIIPNPSKAVAPFIVDVAPIAIDNRKVTDIVPVATPPESKAIPVNSWETKLVRISDIIYPGTKIYHIGILYKTFIMEIAVEKATPVQMVVIIIFFLICPPVASSILLTNTLIDGSASVIQKPMINPKGIRRNR